MTRTVTIRAEGQVQGVNFRAWTRDTATTLGLTGWVRNRRDGSVEAMLSGPDAKVEEMLSRCYDGPSEARVEHIRITENSDTPPNGFSVLPTA